MKSNRHTIVPSQIRSMEDLKKAKNRVKEDISRHEEAIRDDFGQLVSDLSFRNIIAGVTENLTLRSAIFFKAVSIGKSLFSKRKKKKNRE